MPADKGSDEYNTWNVGIINERESWLYSEESWNDYANDDLGIRVKEEEDETEMAYDNFPIKGFSIVNEKNLNIRIDGTKNLIMYKDQGKTELKVRFTGDAGVYPDEDAKITWKLAEGGEKIIQLEPSDDGSYARITELDEGSTYIYVTVDGIGTSVVRIDCEKLGVTSIEIKEEARKKVREDWKTVKVEAGKTSAEFTKLKKGVTYEVQVCAYIDTSEAAEMYWNIEKEYSGKYSESRTVECR